MSRLKSFENILKQPAKKTQNTGEHLP